MGKVLEDFGQLMLLVNVEGAATLGDSNRLSVKLDVENLPKDGNPSISIKARRFTSHMKT